MKKKVTIIPMAQTGAFAVWDTALNETIQEDFDSYEDAERYCIISGFEII